MPVHTDHFSFFFHSDLPSSFSRSKRSSSIVLTSLLKPRTYSTFYHISPSRLSKTRLFKMLHTTLSLPIVAVACAILPLVSARCSHDIAERGLEMHQRLQAQRQAMRTQSKRDGDNGLAQFEQLTGRSFVFLLESSDLFDPLHLLRSITRMHCLPISPTRRSLCQLPANLADCINCRGRYRSMGGLRNYCQCIQLPQYST